MARELCLLALPRKCSRYPVNVQSSTWLAQPQVPETGSVLPSCTFSHDFQIVAAEITRILLSARRNGVHQCGGDDGRCVLCTMPFGSDSSITYQMRS